MTEGHESCIDATNLQADDCQKERPTVTPARSLRIWQRIPERGAGDANAAQVFLMNASRDFPAKGEYRAKCAATLENKVWPDFDDNAMKISRVLR